MNVRQGRANLPLASSPSPHHLTQLCHFYLAVPSHLVFSSCQSIKVEHRIEHLVGIGNYGLILQFGG